MANLLRLVACLFFLLSLNAKAFVVNGCSIEPSTACIDADLSWANLSYADLNQADLNQADLNHASLTYADLSWANLSYTDLHRSYLSYANLSYANLYGADLTEANLSYANLSYADLSGAYLSLAQRYDPVLDNDFVYAAAFLNGAIYNDQTKLPTGFDPIAEGMIFVSEVPLPAGIYLFLSGLAGLGLMRGRNG